jgi:hypothetical protein
MCFVFDMFERERKRYVAKIYNLKNEYLNLRF